jgi:hypothetical protein
MVEFVDQKPCRLAASIAGEYSESYLSLLFSLELNHAVNVLREIAARRRSGRSHLIGLGRIVPSFACRFLDELMA